MADKTGIEWTDATWNPVRGCTRVSEGCRNCYAEGVAYRFGGPGQPYEGLVRIGADGERRREWNGVVRFVEEHLLDPLKWKKPRRIFVNSMSDLFHEGVTDEQLDRIFAVMALCPQHTFQVLTKRPERMLAYLSTCVGRLADVIESLRTDKPRRAVGPLPHLNGGERWFPLANVWLGVSIENQAAADKRIPLLLETPAAVRFLSCEPLLGELHLQRIRVPEPLFGWQDVNVLTGNIYRHAQLVGFYCNRCIDWVIVGGESGTGPGIRPMHPHWVRDLRDQCVAAGVPFFFKQWGSLAPGAQGARYDDKPMACRIDVKGDAVIDPLDYCATDALFYRVGKKAAGDMLDGKQWHEFPEVQR